MVERLLLVGAIGFTLSGCMSLKMALGLRVRLDDKPVTAIHASLADPNGIGPGQSTRLVIVADTTDGKQLVTVGPGKGKVLFSSFTFTSDFAQVDGRGHVSLPDDPQLTEGKTPRVHIVTKGHPEAAADIAVPIRYDVAFRADFSGVRGANGANGADGARGHDGASNQYVDASHPSVGRSGGPGGDGGDGQDGENGENGQNVSAWVTVRPGPHPMLQARVVGEKGAVKWYLIDPAGGTLTIAANGGAGGLGGSGGNAGAGGQGGDGTPPGRDGKAGHPGQPGRPGRGGAAGEIRVTFDPAAEPYRDRFHLESVSGYGTGGSTPTVTVAPVSPLW